MSSTNLLSQTYHVVIKQGRCTREPRDRGQDSPAERCVTYDCDNDDADNDNTDYIDRGGALLLVRYDRQGLANARGISRSVESRSFVRSSLTEWLDQTKDALSAECYGLQYQ